MTTPIRRLIETDELPIGRISAHARKDQNIRRGHLHTLHVWWATRPLAACRAVLLATLLPDPADPSCPPFFAQAAQEVLSIFGSRDLSDPLALRRSLLDFIGHFADWEAAHNPRFVEAARRLVAAAHPEGPPLVVDPFAGAGSIPFEALRIGAEAFASDLNPVAVLLNKVALEYLPRYGTELAAAVRRWGEWVRQRAMAELRHFYPLDPAGAEPLAYLWARTIRCEGPGCGAEVPLVGLLWLSRKERQRVALRYRGVREAGGGRVEFELFSPQSEAELQPPIVKRFAATCPACSYTTPYARVREQLRAKQGGTRQARLIAVITLRATGGRDFRLPTEQDLESARRAAAELARKEAEHEGELPLVPNEQFPDWYSGVFNPGLWNIRTWGDLFAPRQALALTTFVRLVQEAYTAVHKERGDPEFARAVVSCLALAVSQLSHYLSSLSFYWKEGMISAFIQGSGLPMRPDFAEANPLMPKLVGGFDYALEQVAQVLERESGQGLRPGAVRQGSATALPLPDGSTPYVVTDPPYYAAVPYADLSDFCYVWLRRMIGHLYPDLFHWPLTPKDEEAIAYYVQPPNRASKDNLFFEQMMQQALAEARRALRPDGLAVVLFAHKGTAGWEALLNALVQAGWTVTASWPIETERGARMRAKNSAVLASSVFLVCRPRPAEAGIGEWRRVQAEMNRRVAQWLPRLAQEGIHGADAIFAALGPALEVFSRYDRVETAAGEVIPLGDVRNGGQGLQRGYLSYVWEAVAREALRLLFGQADPTGFEEDARLTAMWLWALRVRANGAPALEEALWEDADSESATQPAPAGFALPYDDARLMIQALGADEARLRRPGGILEVKGNTARLLSVAERRRFLLGGVPAEQVRRRQRTAQLPLLELEALSAPEEPALDLQPGQTTLDRLHQAMLLFAAGRTELLRIFLVAEGAGKDLRFWSLADALSRLYPTHSPEKRWVDGLIARRKSLGL